MIIDPISDMFNRIKNAQAVKHEAVLLPASKVKENIASVLLAEGYISALERVENKPQDKLKITLRYVDKQPAISHLNRVSKPGLRRYSDVSSIPRPLSGHGLVIMSTPKGIMSGRNAQKSGLGGEVIATVW